MLDYRTELRAVLPTDGRFPTFRGPEGFWTHGSRVYQPQELATWSAFSADPELVWPWYLWRRQRCREADPNPAHLDLVQLEQHLQDRFTLVTQNVDGLHGRAGNSPKRTFEIHGNIDFYRCVNNCRPRQPVPDLPAVSKDGGFHSSWLTSLTCPTCSAWMRPHVLWFDEYYDEKNYRYESALRAAVSADILIVVGTTGATSLPAHMLQIAMDRGIPVIDINPDNNPFARAAERGPGLWLSTTATEGMAQLTEVVLQA